MSTAMGDGHPGMPLLILQSEVFPGGRLVLAPVDLPLTVGRSHRADVAIPDLLLSRIHAEFRLHENGQFEIVDNESTNLTIVNDQDIAHAFLKSGDRILLGETEFVVTVDHSADHPVPAENPHEKTTRELSAVRVRPDSAAQDRSV
ncbi:MAG: FHA domain-containing protein [Planctomycetaceae bacterium]|nr:FHA domain-containing protein [Planctomycetaceae bacterium]